MSFAENIKMLPVAAVKPYPNNPRVNKAAVDKVAASLREFGWKQPIVVDPDMVIIAGHTRLLAAKKNGDKEVPVFVATDLTPEQVRAYRLADNKTAEFSTWDTRLLETELESLAGLIDMSDFGFEDPGPTGAVQDDFDVDQAVPARASLGEVYLLGEHRLMCGDSTNARDVAVLMDGNRADLIWTDPPWNVNYGADQKHPSWKSRQILNDKMSAEDFYAFMQAAFSNMRSVLRPGGAAYVAMSAQEWGTMMGVMAGLDFHWSSTIIWAKDSLVLSRKDYHTQYEPIWHGWADDPDAPGQYDPIWYGWAEGGPHMALQDRKQSDLWQIPRPKRSVEHPTMKPIELIGRALENSSKVGDVVIDLFGGSGSTLIAAEQLKRRCCMMELDPKYVDVIVARWEALTGKEAVLA
jgi:DNA modification methylase